jgi:ornithine carbamoyltransferase
MANVFLKKTLASMLNMSSEEIDSILNVAEAFKNNEIDRNRAIRIFNKVSKKTPKEINEILKCVDGMIL